MLMGAKADTESCSGGKASEAFDNDDEYKRDFSRFNAISFDWKIRFNALKIFDIAPR